MYYYLINIYRYSPTPTMVQYSIGGREGMERRKESTGQYRIALLLLDLFKKRKKREVVHN